MVPLLSEEVGRSATVYAVRDSDLAKFSRTELTECVLLSRWDFDGEMRRDADIARALVPVLCRRIRELHGRVLRYEPEATTD